MTVSLLQRLQVKRDDLVAEGDAISVLAKDGDLTDEQVLFSASQSRLLFEISPDRLDDLTANLGDVPFAVVGEVTATGKLDFVRNGRSVAMVKTTDAEQAWKRPLDLDEHPDGGVNENQPAHEPDGGLGDLANLQDEVANPRVEFRALRAIVSGRCALGQGFARLRHWHAIGWFRRFARTLRRNRFARDLAECRVVATL